MEHHGDIASVQIFGFRDIIFLGNHALLKEAYHQAELADRPITIRRHGLVSSNGRLWREQRRFALSTLRDFGMGKIALEERVRHETEELIADFSNRDGAFDVKYSIGCAVSNVICSVVFSTRYPCLGLFY